MNDTLLSQSSGAPVQGVRHFARQCLLRCPRLFRRDDALWRVYAGDGEFSDRGAAHSDREKILLDRGINTHHTEELQKEICG